MNYKHVIFWTLAAFVMGTAPKAFAQTVETQFLSTETVLEAPAPEQSGSANWWLRSGGKFVSSAGMGSTLKEELTNNDPLRLAYAAKAQKESDNGYHPQNIFRLLSRKTYSNPTQQIQVKVLKDNAYNRENNQAWNGIVFVGNYRDENNYYYAGARADGYVVIKKKIGGVYHTLNQQKMFPGTYNAVTNPSLLPKNVSLGLKMELKEQNGGVFIRAYINGGSGFTLAAEAVDNGTGGTPILGPGRVGIYADYVDAEFSGYSIASSGSVTLIPSTPNSTSIPTPVPVAIPTPDPAPVPSPVVAGGEYGLATATLVEEAGTMGESSSPHWWVNSGAYFRVANGVGKTVIGELPSTDKWRLAYSTANPLDTDNGYHPQNIFRLLTKSTWLNFTQEGYFKIVKYNTSASGNREAHNALLFFSRYKDGKNLYYTGVRVDGRAVIKKKVNGVYYTMALTPVFPGTYNRTTNPILIPQNELIGLRTVTTTNANGSVTLSLYMDRGKTGTWTKIAEALDDGTKYGPVINAKASAGVRTDFMDVELSNYRLVAQ